MPTKQPGKAATNGGTAAQQRKANKPALTPAQLAEFKALLRLQREQRVQLTMAQQTQRDQFVANASRTARVPLAAVMALLTGLNGGASVSRGRVCVLTAEQMQAVRTAPATVTASSLAADFGVSIATISRVRRGVTRGITARG